MQFDLERQLRRVEHGCRASKVPLSASNKEVIDQCKAMADGHLIDLVLAVAVEGRPFDCRSVGCALYLRVFVD